MFGVFCQRSVNVTEQGTLLKCVWTLLSKIGADDVV